MNSTRVPQPISRKRAKIRLKWTKRKNGKFETLLDKFDKVPIEKVPCAGDEVIGVEAIKNSQPKRKFKK